VIDLFDRIVERTGWTWEYVRSRPAPWLWRYLQHVARKPSLAEVMRWRAGVGGDGGGDELTAAEMKAETGTW
jgi:aminoglycoside/choline kinase family phosphotransferase